MKPYYDKDNITIYNSDCLEVMKGFEDNSIDSIVTDPPAGISFMGKEWDIFDKSMFGIKGQEGKDDLKGFQEFIYIVFLEAYRVLKPGGHCLVWAIPRTSHHTAMGLERAGFEIRDKVYHLFGSGFPKNLNIGKAYDKVMGNERQVI